MITTMRLPIYIALEVEGNADRAQVVRVIENVLIPDVVKHLVAYGDKLTITPLEWSQIQKVCKPVAVRILSAKDALQERK